MAAGNALTLPAGRSPFVGAARVGLRVGALVRLGLRSRRVAVPDAIDDAIRVRAAALRDGCATLVDAHGIRPRVLGRPPVGPSIIVANHLGYLDPLIVSALVPRAPIAKREARGWPLIGRALGEMGLIFVDRGDAASGARALRRARRVLDAGVSVLVFPEGTTTHGDRVLPFHRGVFGLARITGAPVVPTALSSPERACCWVGDDPFVPHYLRLAARPSIPLDIRFGAPMAVEGHATLAAERFRQAVDALRAHLVG